MELTASALLKIMNMRQKTSLLISYIIFLEEFYHNVITCYAQPSQKVLTLPEQLLEAA